MAKLDQIICSYGKDNKTHCEKCGLLCLSRLSIMKEEGTEIVQGENSITITVPDPWIQVSSGVPVYYKSVHVKRGDSKFQAWLSTGSDGDGLYWNLEDNEMLEIKKTDQWKYIV